MTYPGTESQFEANADRARDKLEEFTSLADQAERERRSRATRGRRRRRGLLSTFLDRIRSAVRAIRGD